jgi:cell division protein FtsI (penicillin-binding protein 3)
VRSPRTTRLGRPPVRLRAALLLLVVILSLYVARLFELQGVDAPVYAADAVQGRTVTQTLEAPRGSITDRDGVVLAESVAARDITADPTFVKDPAATAAALAPVLGLDSSEELVLASRLTSDRRFAYVARGVSPQTWERIKALDLAGIYGVATSDRSYPAQTVGANVLGFVDQEGEGSGGVELAYDTLLSGTDGSLTYQRDVQGREITTAASSEVAPVAGSSIRLTLDRDLQWYAQKALAHAVATSRSDSGTAVVMTPQGEILALATSPTFDPNDPGSADQDDVGDRAISDVYEPGSTSKVMTAAAVIEEGGLKPTSRVVVPPVLHRAGKDFHDHDPHGTWDLTFAGVLAKSSNIGTIKAAETIGPTTLYEYLKKFGIGDPTGVGLPGESRGLLPRPEAWSGSQFYTIAFGQGLSLNAVQAASVYATVANGGVRVAPSIVAGTTAPDGTFTPAAAPQETRVVSTRTAGAVSRMLESVVSEEGTAPMAQIRGYRVAGKTGTANRVDDSCGCYRGYTASFIGFAPADNPSLVVAVTLQNPKNGHYGGMLAGPVFKKIMSFGLASLQVPPTGTRLRPYPLTPR